MQILSLKENEYDILHHSRASWTRSGENEYDIGRIFLMATFSRDSSRTTETVAPSED